MSSSLKKSLIPQQRCGGNPANKQDYRNQQQWPMRGQKHVCTNHSNHDSLLYAHMPSMG